MRYYQLFEYNKSALISQYEQKLEDRIKNDHSADFASLDELLTAIETPLRKNNSMQIIDPYMKWIITKYFNNQIRYFEDIRSKAIPSLLTYYKLKKQKKLAPNETDINQIKSLNDLMNIVDKYKEEDISSKSEKKSELEQKFIENKEATILYNDNEMKVIIPHTERASCYFGVNTHWCTAATKSENAFDEYNEKGTIYIILIKKENKR